MRFISETTEQGVTERGFELTVADDRVPGILWTPEGARDPRPLILIGHGGTQHKRVDNVLALARALVRHRGYAAAAIDAPGHGERTTSEAAAAARADIEQRLASRTREWTHERERLNAERTAKAVPEWRATLDALSALDDVDATRVGYWGVSMGTSIGIPFLAADDRVRCAVLGLNGLRLGSDDFEHAARAIAIPLLFVFQWHDQLVGRDAGLALYEAFGSREKTMHVNPGGHTSIPAFEREAYERFYVRHLGSPK